MAKSSVAILVLAASAALAAGVADRAVARADEIAASCVGAQPMGRFDPARDLLVANFDGKPDVDDLQATAALGSVLRDPSYACVDYVAVAGAYGTQTGAYLDAPALFDSAFGPGRWLDAHRDRDEAARGLAQRIREALDRGGRVWVAEAGQSDVTAAALRLVPEADRGQIHVVQHADWNETVTTPADLRFVKDFARYHRISDGNFSDNGTPDFKTEDPSAWPLLLASPRTRDLWREAKRLSEKHNPVAEYVNPAVAAGGLDFSDTAEIAYIFGWDESMDALGFARRFAPPE